MFETRNFLKNDDIKTVDAKGPFRVIEYLRDLSVQPYNAMIAYYCEKMNIHKKQVICDLSVAPITLQAGAVQWMVGDNESKTGIKGVGDLLSKAVRGKATGESAIKPEYRGNGIVVTEPTYKYPIIIDLNDWGGSVVLDDGLFLACDARIRHKTVMRTNISSAVAGNEGLFNLCLEGVGYAVIEADCPENELMTIHLENDVLKIDGNYAIAWSSSLEFSVERSGKTLLGSAASGEGLVNTYRGTGNVMIMPVRDTPVRSL